MPQEIRVLKCYSCQNFQSDIVKKSKKWSCKICGETQSVIKVYFTGNGSECRAETQRLSMAQAEGEETTKSFEVKESSSSDQNQENKDSSNFKSKWSHYV